MVVVAMHHTFDPDYTLPNCRDLKNGAVARVVDCVFFEKQGLLTCPQNEKAIDEIREEVIKC